MRFQFRDYFKRRTALCIAVLFLAGYIFVPSVFADAFSSQSIQTSYCEKGNISIEVKQNEMTVTVPESDEFSYIIVTFMDSQGNTPQEAWPAKVADGSVTYEIAKRREGVYYIQLYRGESAEGTFTGVIGGMESIAVLIEDDNTSIIPSLVYDSSVSKFSSQAVTADALYYYLRPSENVQSDDPDIVKQAQEVTAGKISAYEKLIAVHDWVASNIYYDYDALKTGGGWPVDALKTLQTKRSVCEGYANLATAMLRASGIPAKTMIGYALYSDEESWNLSNMYGDRANHAWTEAFVEGRWTLMDVTWDSDNVYENGAYQTSNVLHTYFDSTLEFFSYTHRQSYKDTYDSESIKIGFSDVAGHWARESIQFAVNNDLMNGVDGSHFSPNSDTTQAMFLTVLSRLCGDQKLEAAAADVSAEESDGLAGMSMGTSDGDGTAGTSSGLWYSSAVIWAKNNGILEGIDKMFQPEEGLDRQMMAVMLRNYVKYMEPEFASEIDFSQDSAAEEKNGELADYKIDSFSDSSRIASWAAEAVENTVRWGLLTGRENGSFAPEDILTRAEMAAVVERLKYKKLMQILG